MRVRANDTGFDVDADTDLLTALVHHGVCARFSCRNGNCGLCEAELNVGSVWLDDNRKRVDAPAKIALCRARAQTDVVLRVQILAQRLSRYCRVSLVAHAPPWHRVLLQLPAGRQPILDYGQMACLATAVSARKLSIVQLPSPASPRELEFWMHDNDREWLTAVHAGALRIELPLGAVFPRIEAATVLVDAQGWDRAQALWRYAQLKLLSAPNFLPIDGSLPPSWFSAQAKIVNAWQSVYLHDCISIATAAALEDWCVRQGVSAAAIINAACD